MSLRAKKEKVDVLATLEGGRHAILEMNSSFYDGQHESSPKYAKGAFAGKYYR